MPLPPAKVKQLCRQSLPEIGVEPHQVQNGIDFYKFFYSNYKYKYADLRVYFRGAEKYTPEQIQKSPRFRRLGIGMLLSNGILAATYDTPMVFKAFIRDLVDRHEERNLDPELWVDFHSIFIKFLETKRPLTDEEKEAWLQLGKDFSNECNTHLKHRGLPYVGMEKRKSAEPEKEGSNEI
uniref:Globin family profile domain-containing protein n=1 Tax=Panagrolaimus sp. JU765 TaxID=591449 RepID=A0AC34QU58_9BILA